MNKTKRIELRLDDKELALFKEKAKNYSSTGCMIRDAVQNYDDRMVVTKLRALNSLSAIIKKNDNILSNIANNTNQLAHYANQLSLSKNYTLEFVQDEIMPAIEKNTKILRDIRKETEMIFKSIIR